MRQAVWLLPTLLLACSGKGNSGRTEVDPALITQVPWINGYPPQLDANKSAIVPAAPVYPPIGANTPDPGSRVLFDTDKHRAEACAALAGINLSSWHHDFEPVREVPGNDVPNVAGTIGVAQFFSAYDDKSDGSWHVPGDASWYADIAGGRGTIPPPPGDSRMTSLPPWGLAADAIQNGPSCDGTPNDWALHIRGGRFNYYGGGTEHPLALDCSLGRQLGDVCDHQIDAVGDDRTDLAIDASAYDGVAFWARRGPDGASGLMINLQDKYTSDRLARTSLLPDNSLSPGVGYCQRIKQCIPSCADGAACVPMQLTGDPPDMQRCKSDDANPNYAMIEPALQQLLYPPCGQSTCVPPSYDPDVDYNDTQCKPYNLTGLEENYYCFGETPPPAADERCGDGYVSNISLSTDWQFYKLPFDRFQQVGFAKKAPPYDVPQKTLYSIAFLFSVGYTDFYVDNLSFYRNQ